MYCARELKTFSTSTPLCSSNRLAHTYFLPWISLASLPSAPSMSLVCSCSITSGYLVPSNTWPSHENAIFCVSHFLAVLFICVGLCEHQGYLPPRGWNGFLRMSRRRRQRRYLRLVQSYRLAAFLSPLPPLPSLLTGPAMDVLTRLEVRAVQDPESDEPARGLLLRLSRPAATVLASVVHSAPASKAAGALVLSHLTAFGASGDDSGKKKWVVYCCCCCCR